MHLQTTLRIFLFWLISVSLQAAPRSRRLVIGGKNFNEGTILAEIMAQLLEAHDFKVDRRFQLGGTMVCFSALINGEIDAYPEYTGTLAQAIFKLNKKIGIDSLRSRLRSEYHLDLLPSFGFNNTYALAIARAKGKKFALNTISDLQQFPNLKFGFSLEFLNRKDGWVGLQKTYNLPQRPRGLEHGLAYMAIQGGEIDVTDAYSTDGDIQKYDLLLLKDDRKFFPVYLGAPLIRLDMPERAKVVLAKLAQRIDENKMQQLNAEVVVGKKNPAEVAAKFLAGENLVLENRHVAASMWSKLLHRTLTHIKLTAIALFAAMALAIPVGILVSGFPGIARMVTYFVGLLQTIPSIALLAFMIPLFGIGTVPAIIALFLYSLLPILRNTVIALFSVDPLLKKVSVGMGMTFWQRLKFVEIPLAAPTILAGVKTAAVINIGTATLAAFIGAGGLGEPIVIGLTLNDPKLILQGAIPAAILAILVELFFEVIEKWWIPAHLRQKGAQ